MTPRKPKVHKLDLIWAGGLPYSLCRGDSHSLKMNMEKTEDESKVTCKRCLKAMKKGKK